MINRRHRFHGHNAVTNAYRQGKVVRAPQMALKYALNPRRQNYRLAVVVSRKVSKSAVVRNRIRRRLFEIIRLQAIERPFDLILTVYDAQIATMPAAELQRETSKMLQKAAVITAVKQ